MRKCLLFSYFIFLFFPSVVHAQENTLFTIGNTKVEKSEFEYIYKKNNFSNKADFSKKSLEDYLDLYINFRLKVKEAIAQGLDTGARFKEELKTYERQLLDSYADKEILDKLIKQEYERSKTDINVSHIFFTVNDKGDTENEVLLKAKEVYKKLKAGAKFELEATQNSEDKQTAKKGGNVGWVNSFQLSYPELEEAAYSMKVGEISEPIRTRSGYHILKLNETRVAKPKIRVAIIKRFFPLGDSSASAMKAIEDTMQSVYTKLKNKIPFETLVQQYSEDDATKTNKGELGWFGINTYAKIFEDNAYALKDEEFSVPFKTKTAWYIIKRLETEKPVSYTESIPILKTKLLNSLQYQYEKDKFIHKIKDANNIKEITENYPAFKQRLIDLNEKGYFAYRDTSNAKPLLRTNTKIYTENDFGKKIQESFYNTNPQQGGDKFDALIKNTAQDLVIDFYKNKIKQDNLEYKALMNEYRNGIMIFALSELKVWNKASEDSIGLLAYYNNHKDNFNLKKRATVRVISASTEKQAKAIHKYLQLHPQISDDSLLIEIKKNGLSIADLNTQMVDETKTKLNITQASLSFPKLNGNKYEITQVYNLQPAKSRTFTECRGYVVAAYQEDIEKGWLQQLRQKYPVEINKIVLESMIRK